MSHATLDTDKYCVTWHPLHLPFGISVPIDTYIMHAYDVRVCVTSQGGSSWT